jgi:large subunit ribosomal protein L24
MKSTKPNKQRKKLYTASLHEKRKYLAAHLEENLLLRYDRRSMPLVTGDTVRVLRGSYRGHEDKVASINTKKRFVEIEGLTITKADGKKIAKPLHPSSLMIIKLNLTDKWRRKKLERGLSEEAKKEIEKEAEEQIREIEEEKKSKEEEIKSESEIKEKISEEKSTTEKNIELDDKTKPIEKIEKQISEKQKKVKEKKTEKPNAEEKKPTKKTPIKKKEEKINE